MNDLGSLSQCLVDSDPESLGRAQRLLRKALAISIFIEAGLVSAMLLWPLITPGVLPGRYNLVPLPPYRGGSDASAKHSPRPHPPQIDRPKYPPVCKFCAPPMIPPQVQNFDGPEPPEFDGGPGGGTHGAPGLPGTGSVLPGGLEAGSRLPAIRPPDQPHENGPVRKGEGVMQAPLLAQSAKAAVREWRYRPTLLNREPVEVETYVTVNFILE